MSNIIADRKFLLTNLHSTDSKIFVMQVLKPEADENGIDYVCELKLVELNVWDRSTFQLHGVDSMQALELALDLKDKILEYIGKTYLIDIADD